VLGAQSLMDLIPDVKFTNILQAAFSSFSYAWLFSAYSLGFLISWRKA